MTNSAIRNSAARLSGCARATILTVLFCLQFNALNVAAQEGKTLSEEPLIVQVFYPEKHETEVKVFLDKDSVKLGSILFPTGKHTSTQTSMYGTRPDSFPPIQSGLLLISATYIYEGKRPADKQGVILIFFSKRDDTFKDNPSYSIIVDDQAVRDGIAESPLQLTLDKDFKQKVIVILPTDVFLSASRGKKVQIKLGSKTYKPEKFQMKYMRALADVIDKQRK